MNRIFGLLPILFCLFFGQSVRAQTSIAFDIYGIDDTAHYYNDTIQIEAILMYNSVAPYQGELTLGYMTTNNGNIISGTVPGYIQPLNFTAQDTMTINAGVPVSPSFFLDGGGHTVIVWPILTIPPSGGVDMDSASFYTNILGWLSQEEWKAEKHARIFPVPATDYITLEKPANIASAQITVMNMQGQVVRKLQATDIQTRIPLSDLPAGNYFVRYSDAVHPPEIHRFVKR